MPTIATRPGVSPHPADAVVLITGRLMAARLIAVCAGPPDRRRGLFDAARIEDPR
jgi:hypothetical protein